MVLAWIGIDRDSCGRAVGWAASAAGWLFVSTVILFMLGVVMATAATEWVAIAAVAVADYGLMVLFLGLNGAHRATILVLLGVHGTCTAVTAGWSRRARGGTRAVRAKASEAGRILASGWIVVLLLYTASMGQRVSILLPDSTLVGLFIVTSISLVMGTGYTKYAEAMELPTAHQQPFSDLISELGSWHRRYSQWF
jgi:hypothetical protein